MKLESLSKMEDEKKEKIGIKRKINVSNLDMKEIEKDLKDQASKN
jgi:hypothetical protein